MQIAVCDDQKEILLEVEHRVKKYFPEHSVVSFQTPIELENYISDKAKPDVDIIFMDIVFEQDNGIYAVRDIQQKFPDIKIIYLTGYIDFVRDVFETDLVYFLLKPIDDAKFVDALGKAIREIKDNPVEKLTIESKSQIRCIPINRITYVESDKRKAIVHMNNEMITYNKKLNEVQDKLGDSFLRCHQSFLVNMKHIALIKSEHIILDDDAVIPISRKYKKDVRNLFITYMGEHLYE